MQLWKPPETSPNIKNGHLKVIPTESSDSVDLGKANTSKKVVKSGPIYVSKTKPHFPIAFI